MKLREFTVTTGQLSADAEHCREIRFSLAFEQADGSLLRRNQETLIFEGILGDPDQIPWLIASTLRELMAKSGDR